jgi:hypothetical protein
VATVLTRRRKTLLKNRDGRTFCLTTTGLLMEGDYTHNPTTVAGDREASQNGKSTWKGTFWPSYIIHFSLKMFIRSGALALHSTIGQRLSAGLFLSASSKPVTIWK